MLRNEFPQSPVSREIWIPKVELYLLPQLVNFAGCFEPLVMKSRFQGVLLGGQDFAKVRFY